MIPARCATRIALLKSWMAGLSGIREPMPAHRLRFPLSRRPSPETKRGGSAMCTLAAVASDGDRAVPALIHDPRAIRNAGQTLISGTAAWLGLREPTETFRFQYSDKKVGDV